MIQVRCIALSTIGILFTLNSSGSSAPAGEPIQLRLVKTVPASISGGKHSIVYSADGRRVAVAAHGGTEGEVTLLDAAAIEGTVVRKAGNQEDSIQLSLGEVLVSRPFYLAMNSNGSRVAISADRLLYVWDIAERALYIMPKQFVLGVDESYCFGPVRFVHQGRSIAAVAQGITDGKSKRVIILVDVESRQLTRVLDGHSEHISTFDVSADGRWGISGDFAGGLCLWDIAEGRLHRKLRLAYPERNAVAPLFYGSPECINYAGFIKGNEDRVVTLWRTAFDDNDTLLTVKERMSFWKLRQEKWIADSDRLIGDEMRDVEIDSDCSRRFIVSPCGTYLAAPTINKRKGVLIEISSSKVVATFSYTPEHEKQPVEKQADDRDVDDGPEKRENAPTFTAIAISPDCKRLLTVDEDGVLAEFEMPVPIKPK